MKRWLTGFIAGVVFTVMAGLLITRVYTTETINLFSNLYGQRVVGKTKVLLHDSLIYQDGVEIGTLKRGTMLLHRLQTESLEEFYLPMGWENREEMEKVFGSAERFERAFVILETGQ